MHKALILPASRVPSRCPGVNEVGIVSEAGNSHGGGERVNVSQHMIIYYNTIPPPPLRQWRSRESAPSRSGWQPVHTLGGQEVF